VGPENPLKVEKDDTAQLECLVDAKPTVSMVKWTRNGRFIDTHFKHTIPRVTLQDSGSYVCSADNSLGQVPRVHEFDKSPISSEISSKYVHIC
jgi:echinoid protein